MARDYFDVRSGQDHSSVWASQWLTVPALLVAPIGFLWANWELVGPSPKISRLIAAAALAIAASAIWFIVVAWYVLGAYHYALTGRLS
jgi:hypothetical protein